LLSKRGLDNQRGYLRWRIREVLIKWMSEWKLEGVRPKRLVFGPIQNKNSKNLVPEGPVTTEYLYEKESPGRSKRRKRSPKGEEVLHFFNFLQGGGLRRRNQGKETEISSISRFFNGNRLEERKKSREGRQSK